MIAALRGAVFEALKREEENAAMFKRLAEETQNKELNKFFTILIKDTEEDMHKLKHLNLHSIIKFGLTIKFEIPEIIIDEKLINSITDKTSARESLKLALDQVNTNIEYYEHIASHSIFPETKRLFRIIADKELVHKSKIKALYDLIE